MLDEDDHRHLGNRLDLFHFQEEAAGMVFWHPRGWTLYRVLEESVRRVMTRDGYREVRSPQILRRVVWEASGHWQSFAQDMFQLDQDGMEAAIKPVSCPAHLMLVRRMAPSFRDLPLRIGELGLVHRNEASGALHGLFRLRQFTQDDGHIFCAEGQIAQEVARFYQSLVAYYRCFGFEGVQVAFSSRPAVRAGDDQVWDMAERLLVEAADQVGLRCIHQPGQGAFYGPKLEFGLQDRMGRMWQCGTIQLDLVLADRFQVAYTSADGSKQRPALLHRALLGSLERFMGIVLEQTQGRLPLWLAPDQVVVAPVSEHQRQYALAVRDQMLQVGLRVAVDDRPWSVARRIVDAHALGIPAFVTVGRREVDDGSMDLRQGTSRHSVKLEQGIAWLCEQAKSPI